MSDEPTAQTKSAGLTDGTINAVVAAPPRDANGVLRLWLALPRRLEIERAAGRFVLARCGAQTPSERAEQWSIYLRRTLFVASPARPEADDLAVWQFSSPRNAQEDPGYRWLAQRRTGEVVNLTGPYGVGFPLPPHVRRLLLLAEPERLDPLLPLMDEALDRGGQVSLLLAAQGSALDTAAMRASLPLSVELHTLDNTADSWEKSITASLRWADQVCAALPVPDLPRLAEGIRLARKRLESGFAFALVDADLACGYGACLACVVPLANGNLTRACVHGPAFDLLELAGRE